MPPATSTLWLALRWKLATAQADPQLAVYDPPRLLRSRRIPITPTALGELSSAAHQAVGQVQVDVRAGVERWERYRPKAAVRR